MSAPRQFIYLADEDGGDGRDVSSITFGRTYGAVDPSAAYDDPALWCHPSATPDAPVVPSQLSSLASVQSYHVPPQRRHPSHHTAQDIYQNGRPYAHLLPGSVHSTTSCDIPNAYRGQRDVRLSGNLHVPIDGAVSAPLETAPAQAASPYRTVSLPTGASQDYAPLQPQYAGVAASVQHFPIRSATMPCPPSLPFVDPTSTYYDLTDLPPHFAEQNSGGALQYQERGRTFPDPSRMNALPPHLGIHPQGDHFQPTKSLPYLSSNRPHSPYTSPPSLSPSPSFISSPEASAQAVLPGIAYTEAASSRPASSRSSSATSSPFSTTHNLQATATPSPASSSASLSTTGSDSQRFACRQCRGERTFSRTKDLERHIQSIHNRDPDAPRWICCGVPLSEADRWALPEWVRREPPYMLNGVPMVGGCKEHCSRKDVLKRHLRKNESRCFGSENAPWLLGNQMHKRSPRAGGKGAGGGAGRGGMAADRG